MASELHSWLSHWMLIVFVLSILLILTFNKALLILVQRMTEYAFRALLSWLAISCTCMYVLDLLHERVTTHLLDWDIAELHNLLVLSS